MLNRRLVAERPVEAHWIVERFDVLEHTQSGILQVLEQLAVGPLVLQRPEESFHRRVVVAVACAPHRTFDAQRLQDALIGLGSVLAIAVLMAQQLLNGFRS